jgi:hypothetical protein
MRAPIRRAQFAFLGVVLAALGMGWWRGAGEGTPEADSQTAEPQAASEQDGEVLTRGPIHEAFATPVSFDPEPGIIVSKEPPNAIEELPPDVKLEGENVVWIGGYWGWDPDRKDFIWVSGFYRAVPPDRQWMPGYWRKVEGGYQWNPGYWAPLEGKVEYLPPPPASVEVGPSSETPSVDHVWVPGCWLWIDGHYVWRAGHWYVPRPGWVYVPAHYVWTPCGFVFVDGYWDYAIERRGLLFCPVYFAGVVYTRPGFVYAHHVAVDTGLLTFHLFAWPHYHHYCFGDFYAGAYVRAGIYPWFSFHTSHGYDPFFAHHFWVHGRRDPQWIVKVHADYRFYRDNEDARPPRTLAAQRALVASRPKSPGAAAERIALAKPVSEMADAKQGPLRLAKLEESQRKEAARQAKEIRGVTSQRAKLETDAAAKPTSDPKTAKPVTRDLPRSSVVGKRSKELGASAAPPPTPERPRSSPEVKPRQPRPSRPKPEDLIEPKRSTETKPRNPKTGDRPKLREEGSRQEAKPKPKSGGRPKPRG